MPALSIMLGMREVLRMIDAEGLPEVFRRHERPARATRAWVGGSGALAFGQGNPRRALTAVLAPSGIDSEKIVATLLRLPQHHDRRRQGEIKGRILA
jgi:aspartate aminotransferase-like enzyme